MERSDQQNGDAFGSTDGSVDAALIIGNVDGLDGGSGGGSDGNGGSGGDVGGGGRVEQPVKRGRGRPRKDGSATVVGGSTDRQRRNAKPSQASVSASIDGLSRTLLLLHFGIANGIAQATKNENLARVFLLSPQEAQMIAEPAAALMSNYVGVRSPETQLWVNLAMALGGVYGGKLLGGMIEGKANGGATT